jgi:hypothetical protein
MSSALSRTAGDKHAAAFPSGSDSVAKLSHAERSGKTVGSDNFSLQTMYFEPDNFLDGMHGRYYRM